MCQYVNLRVVPVMTGGGRSAPAADRRGSRLYIHPTAKELQIHVHLQSSTQSTVTAQLLKIKPILCVCRKVTCAHTQTHNLAGGRLHHVVAGAHDASVWLGDRGLSVDVGGLGLGGSGRQRQ